MFKICSIGCGGMSNRVHGPGMSKYAKENPETVLAACCDLDREKAENYHKKFNFQRFYTDMDEMLDSEQPDAVCLITPISLTAKLAQKIIAKGYPLIMEKPAGADPRECRKIIAAAKKHNVPAQVAFNRRHVPLARVLKKRLADCGPENIQFIECNFQRYQACNNEFFRHTAIHGIDMVKFLAGCDYREVNFFYYPLADSAVWNIHMVCTMESGFQAFLNFGSGLTCENYKVALANNTLSLDLDAQHALKPEHRVTLTETGADGKATVITEPSGEFYIAYGFHGENEHFFNDIRQHGTLSEGGVADSLQSLEIAACLKNCKKYFTGTK